MDFSTKLRYTMINLGHSRRSTMRRLSYHLSSYQKKGVLYTNGMYSSGIRMLRMVTEPLLLPKDYPSLQ